MLMELMGTISLGLKTMVLPSISALGMVQCGTMLGKLNGAMLATTPRGLRSIRHSTPLLTSSNSPCTS